MDYKQCTVREIMIREIKLRDNLNDEIRFYFLYSAYIRVKYAKGDQTILDFTDVQFIIPCCILGLLSLCKYIYQRTRKKIRLVNISSDLNIYQYLERVDFFLYALPYIEIEGDYSGVLCWSRDPIPSKLFGISKIDKNIKQSSIKVVEMISLFRDRYTGILNFFIQNHKYSERFLTILSEITANIPEHAKSDGFVLLQKYENKRTGKVSTSLSIMDNGIGIKKRIIEQVKNKSRRPIKGLKTDADYISFAFSKEGTRSGAGLYGVVKRLYEWDGNDIAFLALSGRGLMYKPQGDPKIHYDERTGFFNGTHITIWFYGTIDN